MNAFSPTVTRLSGSTMLSSALHLPNAANSKWVRPSGKVTLTKPEQPLKVPVSIFVMPSGI